MSHLTGNERTVSIQVFGRVQGVWFRGSTQQQAQSLGLRGWVKNMPDGSVYLEVQGDSAAVDKLIEWCRSGPELARVDKVDIADLGPVELPAPFSIQRH